MQHIREYYKNNKQSGKTLAVLDTIEHKEIYKFIKNNDFDNPTRTCKN